MRGNFELKLQNSPKLPRIHARFYSVMQMSKVNREKGYFRCIGAILIWMTRRQAETQLVATKNRLAWGKLMSRQILTRFDPNKKSAVLRQTNKIGYCAAAFTRRDEYSSSSMCFYVIQSQTFWSTNCNALASAKSCFTFF